MRIFRHIAFWVTEREQKELSKLGIDLKIGFESFDIAKTDPRWDNVQSVLANLDLVGQSFTEFSKADLKNAKFLKMIATSLTGYPQPEDPLGYLQATYDLSGYCKECGVGKVQNAPFRLKRTPVFAKKDILQLNWVFDQFFVTPSAWERVFRPFGIQSRPVLLASGTTVDAVVQLDIQSSCSLELDGFEFEICGVCGRRKYAPNYLGYAPKPTGSNEAIFHSQEDFGSGASAFKLVLVSDKFYKHVLDVGLKGVVFHACAS